MSRDKSDLEEVNLKRGSLFSYLNEPYSQIYEMSYSSAKGALQTETGGL